MDNNRHLWTALPGLSNWNTNNEGLGNGLATYPNVRIEEGNDVGVSLRTAYGGIDGSYSGIISQTVTTERLNEITYLSKCDSIFDSGACIVNIYNDIEQLVLTDSLFTEELNYSTKTIDITQIQNLQSEFVTLEFIGFGQLGQLEPFQSYAEFNILNVNANYISSTSESQLYDTNVFPNPFNSTISISISDINNYEGYIIYNSAGKFIKNGEGNTIDTRDLPRGKYFIQIDYDSNIITKAIVKH